MNKNIKNLNIPKLRFPEFIDSGEWVEKKLGNELVFQTGFPFESSGFNKNQQGVRLIKNKDLRSDDNKVYYNKPFDEKYLVDDGDVLIGMDGDFTPCIWNKGKALLNQRVGKIKAKNKKQELFFYYLLIIHLKEIEEKTPRTTVKHLSHSVIESLKYFVPPTFPEQQKIADCLLSLDEMIEAEKQHLEQLKRHKKALLQNLFPQQGEKVPKLRFPEFADSGEWEEKTLGEVGVFLKGKGISKTDVVENGKTPCIRYGELYTFYKETINDVISFTNVPIDELVLSKKNDVIIPSSGETQEDIATASCIMKDEIALGGDLNIIRTEINGLFLTYYLNNPKKQDIARMAQGISVVHLYASQLKNLIFTIPTQKEQEKIANCLSLLDETIQTQIERIEQLKKHKKGLLQNLFPRMRG